MSSITEDLKELKGEAREIKGRLGTLESKLEKIGKKNYCELKTQVEKVKVKTSSLDTSVKDI